MDKFELCWRRAFQRVALVMMAGALGASGCSKDDPKPAATANAGGAGHSGTGGTSAAGKGGTGGTGAVCASPGGADTSEGANTHCSGDGGVIAQVTGACTAAGDAADAGADSADAGALSSVLGGDYGDTNYGLEAFDDDCKYSVSWTSTPICDNSDTTFTVTVTSTADGKAVTGAKPYVEVFKIAGDSVHFPTATHQVPTEKGKGVYEIGPIKFNESGQWVVRFHFFEECADSEDSPHGHAAFYVKVP